MSIEGSSTEGGHGNDRPPLFNGKVKRWASTKSSSTFQIIFVKKNKILVGGSQHLDYTLIYATILLTCSIVFKFNHSRIPEKKIFGIAWKSLLTERYVSYCKILTHKKPVRLKTRKVTESSKQHTAVFQKRKGLSHFQYLTTDCLNIMPFDKFI